MQYLHKEQREGGERQKEILKKLLKSPCCLAAERIYMAENKIELLIKKTMFKMTRKKKLFSGLFALALLATTAVGVAESKKSEANMSDLAIANVEALANGESGGGLGCHKAAYEWDNDWWEDTKTFIKCKSGCPEGKGTSPKYTDC